MELSIRGLHISVFFPPSLLSSSSSLYRELNKQNFFFRRNLFLHEKLSLASLRRLTKLHATHFGCDLRSTFLIVLRLFHHFSKYSATHCWDSNWLRSRTNENSAHRLAPFLGSLFEKFSVPSTSLGDFYPTPLVLRTFKTIFH